MGDICEEVTPLLFAGDGLKSVMFAKLFLLYPLKKRLLSFSALQPIGKLYS